MKLTSACFGLGGVYMGTALLLGLAMQVELFSPGLQLSAESWQRAYPVMVRLHASLLQFGLPMSLIAALGIAIFAEARGFPSVNVAGWGMLLTGLFLVGLDVMRISVGIREVLVAMVVAAAGAGVAMTICADRTARISRLIFAAFGALMLVAAIGYSWLLDQAGHGVLADTYVAVAAQHALGIALVLWVFAVTTAWAARKGQAPETWMTVVLAIGLFGAGVQMVRWTMALGLNGMPRRYIDYPEQFEPAQQQVSVWAAAFMVFLIAATVRTWRLSRLPPPSPAEVF